MAVKTGVYKEWLQQGQRKHCGMMSWCGLLVICATVLAVSTTDIMAAETGKTLNCATFNLPVCTETYNPICGTDGETYTNECLLCLHNWVLNTDVGIFEVGKCERPKELYFNDLEWNDGL